MLTPLFSTVIRKFVDEIIYPDAQAREEDGKRASKEVLEAMAWVTLTMLST